MADAVQPAEPVAAAPAETPVAATAPVETPVAQPAAAAPEPAVAEPAAQPAAEAAPAKTEEKPEVAPAEPPSLLEAAGKEPEEKAAEAAKPEDKPAEPAAEPALEWDVKLPETLKADDATLARFKDNLSSLLKPKEGETPSHAAQRLVDMHNEALVAYDKMLRENQIKAWNDVKANWRAQSMADPTIGGAGHDTAMGAIARVRDALISNSRPGTKRYDADAQEFNDFLRATGAGDHPAFLKFLHRAARYIDEPSMPSVKASPPPDIGRKPGRSLYADTSAR